MLFRDQIKSTINFTTHPSIMKIVELGSKLDFMIDRINFVRSQINHLTRLNLDEQSLIILTQGKLILETDLKLLELNLRSEQMSYNILADLHSFYQSEISNNEQFVEHIDNCFNDVKNNLCDIKDPTIPVMYEKGWLFLKNKHIHGIELISKTMSNIITQLEQHDCKNVMAFMNENKALLISINIILSKNLDEYLRELLT